METRSGPSDHGDSVLRQAWLEEQAALYQAQCEGPTKPSPVEFAARATLPEGAEFLGIDLRARLIRRLRVLEGLRQALGSPGGQEVEEFQPGDVFQDLEILEPIGKGGMGRVYRARQKSLGRLVAIKTPHWAASLNPREKARFWREAQAIARIRHPGIVPLFAVGQRGGTPFLVLELVEGRPLSDVIQRLKRGALPRVGASLGRDGVSFEIAAAGIAIEILSALQAAHDAEIVHRDMKPDNVMLEGSGRVRVLDFGLAKLQSSDSLTNSQEFLGTLQFMAPEILEDAKGVSPVSDVYSVGVLLYELLSLELPFGETTMRALMKRLLTDEPQSLYARCRIPRPLSAIVAKAVAREPSARYQSAREFATDLEAFIRGSAVSARPSIWSGRLPQAARAGATPLVLTLSAIAVTTLVVVKAFDLDRAVQAAPAPTGLRDELRSALLWELADVPRAGGWPALDLGRERALDMLETAAREDPQVVFPRARVHLAVLAAERGDAPTVERCLTELESAGWQYEMLEWIRAAAARPGSIVRPPEGRALESLATDVDRFYSVRAAALDPDRPSAPSGTAGLEKHPVYSAPVLFLESLHETEGPSRDLGAAIAGLREVLELVPRHPVVVAALLRFSCEGARDRARGDPEVARALAPLAHTAALTAESQPVHPGFWAAYGSLLEELGDPKAARNAFESGLERSPSDPRLLGGMAQTYLDELSDGAARAESDREQLLSSAIALVADAVEAAPALPENRRRLDSLQRLSLSPEQERVLRKLAERVGDGSGEPAGSLDAARGE